MSFDSALDWQQKLNWRYDDAKRATRRVKHQTWRTIIGTTKVLGQLRCKAGASGAGLGPGNVGTRNSLGALRLSKRVGCSASVRTCSLKATGVVYEISEVHVFKLQNGKAVQLMVFEDTAPIIAALQGYRRQRCESQKWLRNGR